MGTREKFSSQDRRRFTTANDTSAMANGAAIPEGRHSQTYGDGAEIPC